MSHKRKMTVSDEVFYVILESFEEGDLITIKEVHARAPYLDRNNASSALHCLASDGWGVLEKTGRFLGTGYAGRPRSEFRIVDLSAKAKGRKKPRPYTMNRRPKAMREKNRLRLVAVDGVPADQEEAKPASREYKGVEEHLESLTTALALMGEELEALKAAVYGGERGKEEA